MLLLTFASPALAQGGGEEFIFGTSRTLEDGEVINGDLIVFGGNVDITESSKVDGDLVVIGGNADVDGTVTGDVEVLGGNVDLNETAVVEGSVNVIGGNINRAEGVEIKGKVESFKDFGDDDDDDGGHDDFGPPIAPGPPAFNHSSGWGFFNYAYYAIEETAWDLSWIIGLALIAWVVAAFLPEQMQTVGDTVAQTPLVSFGMGLLTAILAAILLLPSILLVITICLAIIPFAGYTLLMMGALFGWIAIGQLLGERLLGTMDRPLPGFVMSTIIGVVLLTALSKMPVIGIIPIIGWVLGFFGGLFGIIVSLTGLGAVILTRYGTRPYAPGNGSTPRSSGGGSAYQPYTPPPPPGGFDRTKAAEEELKAKIKAALAEADAAEGKKKDEPEPEEPSGDPSPEDKPADDDEPRAKD